MTQEHSGKKDPQRSLPQIVIFVFGESNCERVNRSIFALCQDFQQLYLISR